MDLGINGRKAIVCASSRGLGKACAISLARNGVHVTLNGRDESVLATTAQEIRNLAPDIDVITVAGNVSDPQCQQALLDATPGADILINNNGGPPFRDFRELDRKAMTEGVTMNMITPIEMINGVIDDMSARGFGRIVNITSISVKKPVLGLDLSSGARAGLTAFLAGVCRSVAHNNVTINNILPGPIDTPLYMGIPETWRLEKEASMPIKRPGRVEEVVPTVLLLASDAGSFYVGASMNMNGGDVMV